VILSKPMPKKKEAEGLLVDAAKKIGALAGKVASLVGAEAPAPAPRTKNGKFVKSVKKRVPRKQKKAAQEKTAQKKNAGPKSKRAG
jgi:hypothetical protein